MSEQNYRRPKPVLRSLALACAVIAAFLAGFFLLQKFMRADPGNTPVTEIDLKPATPPLVGKWLRGDGGYVIEIRKVADDGSLEAAYFNPRPIHVSVARWRQDASAVRVFLELRDTNYPGATYNLALAADGTRLTGLYTQPLTQETFDVSFERQPADAP
jgi:hypothetical protein